jgi:hypothetical protein
VHLLGLAARSFLSHVTWAVLVQLLAELAHMLFKAMTCQSP